MKQITMQKRLGIEPTKFSESEKRPVDPHQIAIRAHRRSERELIDPKDLTNLLSRYQWSKTFRTVLRESTHFLAAIAIFLIAGLLHHFEFDEWYWIALVAVVVVSLEEYVARPRLERWLERWDHRNLRQTINDLGLASKKQVQILRDGAWHRSTLSRTDSPGFIVEIPGNCTFRILQVD
jgi:hypothetical protein